VLASIYIQPVHQNTSLHLLLKQYIIFPVSTCAEGMMVAQN